MIGFLFPPFNYVVGIQILGQLLGHGASFIVSDFCRFLGLDQNNVLASREVPNVPPLPVAVASDELVVVLLRKIPPPPPLTDRSLSLPLANLGGGPSLPNRGGGYGVFIRNCHFRKG
jgi:hypothetical protein